MSLFSTGGTSFPDSLIVAFLVILAVISLIFNPIVFLYNFKKPKSIPKVLFLMLAVLDFTTCIFYPLCSIYLISKLETHPKCHLHPTYGPLCHGWFAGSPHFLQRIRTLIGSILYQSPSCVTALLTVCRLKQLQYPFR